MQTEIPRTGWPSFFESFTHQHDHWLVSVDGERGLLSLEGISLRADGNLVIHLGGDISHHRVITIDPKRVVLDRQAGVDEGVDTESWEKVQVCNIESLREFDVQDYQVVMHGTRKGARRKQH